MSDVGINVPPWLALIVLGVEFWPIVAILAVAAIVAAYCSGGVWRWVAFAVAALFTVDLAVAVAIGVMRMRDAVSARAYDQSVASTLATGRTINGLNLPAGTEITWTDPTQARIAAATLPQPAPVLGVLADMVQPTVDGGWALHLSGPQSVDGWTCQPDLVEIAPSGHLRRCVIATGREWNGWPIPPATLVTLSDLTVGFVFPIDAPVMAREIDRPLPATGGMTMNADGSLDSVYFDAEAPLAICGAALWNTVAWRYDPATFGQGRNRKPAGISGAALSGDPLAFSLPGCTK